MSYQRFDVSKISLGPATVATVATVLPGKTQSVASVASVAMVKPDCEDSERESVASVATVARVEPAPEHLSVKDGQALHDESAAIVEYDGGAPREWAEGFARLDCSAPPPGYSLRQWEQVLDDGGKFLDRWAAEAMRLGWTAEDVFGIHPTAPGARVDAMGLVPLINGGEVVSITADRASIRMPGGSVLAYLRRPRSDAVVLWELVR